MKNLYIILFCLAIMPAKAQDTSTQDNKKKEDHFVSPGTWTIAPKLGFTQFYGELNSQKMSGIYGIGLEKRISPAISAVLELDGGNLQGEKKDFYNSRFRADFGQASLLAKLNLTQLFGKRRRERIRLNVLNNATENEIKLEKQFQLDSTEYVTKHLSKAYKGGPLFSRFNVSAYAGFGALRYSSFAYDITTGALQRYTSIAGVTGGHTPIGKKYGEATSAQGIYYTKERSIHVGLQATYAISNNLDLGLDWRISRVGNDKIDATSGGNNLTGAAGNVWGKASYSSTANDHFGYLAIRLGVHFGEGRASKEERKAYERLKEKARLNKSSSIL